MGSVISALCCPEVMAIVATVATVGLAVVGMIWYPDAMREWALRQDTNWDSTERRNDRFRTDMTRQQQQHAMTLQQARMFR